MKKIILVVLAFGAHFAMACTQEQADQASRMAIQNQFGGANFVYVSAIQARSYGNYETRFFLVRKNLRFTDRSAQGVAFVIENPQGSGQCDVKIKTEVADLLNN